MPSTFIEIICCSEKNQLEKLCRTSTIIMKEIVDFIVACKAGVTGLNHRMHYVDFVPDELKERENDWTILNGGRQEQASKSGQKALRRLFKSHGKRQYRVGHMFFASASSPPIREWHFVFFEVNELRTKHNHWEMGPHVHITNYLWPNLDCQSIWAEFVVKNAFPTTKLHLSCLDENSKSS